MYHSHGVALSGSAARAMPATIAGSDSARSRTRKPVTLLAAPRPAAGWRQRWNSGSPSGVGPTRGSTGSCASRAPCASRSVLKAGHPSTRRTNGARPEETPRLRQAVPADERVPLDPVGVSGKPVRHLRGRHGGRTGCVPDHAHLRWRCPFRPVIWHHSSCPSSCLPCRACRSCSPIHVVCRWESHGRRATRRRPTRAGGAVPGGHRQPRRRERGAGGTPGPVGPRPLGLLPGSRRRTHLRHRNRLRGLGPARRRPAPAGTPPVPRSAGPPPPRPGHPR